MLHECGDFLELGADYGVEAAIFVLDLGSRLLFLARDELKLLLELGNGDLTGLSVGFEDVVETLLVQWSVAEL